MSTGANKGERIPRCGRGSIPRDHCRAAHPACKYYNSKSRFGKIPVSGDEQEHAGSGRRRWPGWPDAGPGSRIARHRRHDRRTALSRRATRTEMQPRFGPLDGDLSPAWHRDEATQLGSARRLSERPLLSHVIHRDRVRTDSYSLPARSVQRQNRPRRPLANARTSASR